MRKIVVHSAGGHDRLRLEDHPDPPPPGPGEVAIEVGAIGVNYADCVVRMGLYASAREYVGWPITPGFEVAGTVAAVGPDVRDLAPGARAIALTRFGGYATRLVVPRNQVFETPAGLATEAAAAFPAVHLTAHYALFELAHPRKGSRLLVHSAAGGVGSALLQLARIAECEAVAVVGAPHKVATARDLGAAAVIDKSSEPLWDAARRHAPAGYDVVLDANGVSTLAGSYAALAPTGRLVVYGFHSMLPRQGGRPSWLKLAWDWLRTPRFNPLEMTNANKSVLAFNLSYLFERKDILAEAMASLLGHVRDGRLRPPPIATYPLARAADAHRDIESGATVGKLVLVP